MTAPRNDQLQAALVGYLKTVDAITDQLKTPEYPTGTANEIRENEWQGTEFEYPNIRVRMIENHPYTDNPACTMSWFSVSFMAYSQDPSSQEADRIAGIIASSLSGKSFEHTGVTGTVSVYLRTTDLIPAVRFDVHTWRSECLMRGTASV